MLFLSTQEKTAWADHARTIQSLAHSPDLYINTVRPNLYSAFCYFIGTLLAAENHPDRGKEWLKAGAITEEEGLFSSFFLLGFLERHGGMLKKPAVAFEDPRPFIHFTHIPAMVEARRRMISFFAGSLPKFWTPVRFMDIGCGDGSLTVRFLQQLIDSGKVPGFSEILLIDPSTAMIELAKDSVSAAFPDVLIKTENARIEDCSARINNRYDIALSSLAYHHMPVEEKYIHIRRIKPWIDHFLLFELDADHDTPEMYSPELAFSVYQSYGRIIDLVFAYDAPVSVVTDCVDLFWITEIISILTEPRGIRTDYHMLRNQWNELFKRTLCPEFSLRSDSTCYGDEYVTLFALHYGREEVSDEFVSNSQHCVSFSVPND